VKDGMTNNDIVEVDYLSNLQVAMNKLAPVVRDASFPATRRLLSERRMEVTTRLPTGIGKVENFGTYRMLK
jgi:hypothetical protein